MFQPRRTSSHEYIIILNPKNSTIHLRKKIIESEEFLNYVYAGNSSPIPITNLTDEFSQRIFAAQKLSLYRYQYKIDYLKKKWPEPSRLFQSYLFINGTKELVLNILLLDLVRKKFKTLSQIFTNDSFFRPREECISYHFCGRIPFDNKVW